MSPCFASTGAMKNAAYTITPRRTKTRAAAKMFFPMPSFLQKIFAEKPQRRQKNQIEHCQDDYAFPLHERLPVEQALRNFRARNENRRQQGQQEKGQEQFAHPRLRRNGRKRR